MKLIDPYFILDQLIHCYIMHFDNRQQHIKIHFVYANQLQKG